jgi:hypothetical protein
MKKIASNTPITVTISQITGQPSPSPSRADAVSIGGGDGCLVS